MNYSQSSVEPRFILGESSHNIYLKMEKTKHWWKVEFPHNIPVRKGKIYSPFSPSCLPVERKKTEARKGNTTGQTLVT